MTVNKSAGDMNNNDVIFLKSYSRTKMFEYLSLFFFSTPERYYRVSMYHSNGLVCFFMREANMKKTTQL